MSSFLYEMFWSTQVAHTGPGIPEEEHTRVFILFYRGQQDRAQEGLGLGLFLTRSILIREGGYVKLSSKPGAGSVFALCLPLE